MIEVKPGGRCIVAIPARDEESRIGACLAALAADPCPAPLTVILFANDCEDRTCDVARHAAGSCGLDLRIIEECLPSGRRHVGEARGRAMEAAARLARPADVLLTTDADSRVQPGWRAANLHAIADGADLVCGVAVIDPVEALAIDPRLHEDDARECAYGALLDEIAALLDPDPADPWPRHLEESGASIAIRAEVFRHIGGVPCVAIGEDRALVRRAAALDARIRHDPQIRVIVSGRLQGRAAGGMADTIRRRMQCQDDFIDARLEPVSHWLRRVRLRAAVRAARRSGLMDLALADRLGVAPSSLACILNAPFFGAAWSALEAESRLLSVRHPIPHAALAMHTARARRIRDRLRRHLSANVPIPTEDPADRSIAAESKAA
jgi:GT2 family glycosyltransferase